MMSARWPREFVNHFSLVFVVAAGWPVAAFAQIDVSPSDIQPAKRASGASSGFVGSAAPTGGLPSASSAAVIVPAPTGVAPAQAEAQPPKPAPAKKQLSATSSDPLARNLQTIVIQAVGQLDAGRLPQLATAKQQLQNSILQLEQYIQPTSTNGQAWSKFLRLGELKQEVAADKPSVDKLVELELNMRQNYLGLELAPYQAVRSDIGRVVRALRYGNQPDKTIEVLQTKLEQLVEILDEPAEGAATERNYAVGLVTNYLHEMDQAPSALEQLRQQYSSPNVQVFARESLVNRLASRPVAQPSGVNECLLGTRIIGRACMAGAVSVDVLPMVGGVSLQLNLNANLSTQTNGYNRGVVLGNTGHSPVAASKQIFVTPTGISASPTSVATNLQTSINTIDHRLRIVRRIARRKAAEQKPLADSIAEGRLQNRVRNQYDEQVNQQLAQANVKLASFQNESRPELARLGVPKPVPAIYSTSTTLHADVRQASSFQLSAHQTCPLAKPSSADVVVEAHQSAVVNALDIVLGDRTIRNADLDDYAKQITGSVTAEVLEETKGESWSITLAAYRPVEIEFDEGLVKLKLRVVRMTRGKQALEDPAFVTASYLPQYRDSVLSLTRQGPVDVTFARATRGLRVVTLRSFLKGKFDKFFKEQFVTQRLDSLPLPPNVPRFNVDSLSVDNGWLQVGLR